MTKITRISPVGPERCSTRNRLARRGAVLQGQEAKPRSLRLKQFERKGKIVLMKNKGDREFHRATEKTPGSPVEKVGIPDKTCDLQVNQSRARDKSTLQTPYASSWNDPGSELSPGANFMWR